MEAVVLHKGVLDMQVCVPKKTTDEEVMEFANKENPCGTEHGWYIRREELLVRYRSRTSRMY